MADQKMDWLRMETRIREVYKEFLKNNCESPEALALISNVIGEETGRGFPLDG